MGDDIFKGLKPVTLEEMLDAREKRAVMQQNMLRKFNSALICFTMNVPGAYKRFPLLERAFDEGVRLIKRRLRDIGAEVAGNQEIREMTGCEGFYAVNAAAAALKKLAMQIEGQHPLGRLFDIDVFSEDGTRLRGEDFGRNERSCLICGGPVWQCSRNRTHTAEELSATAAGIMRGYFDEKFAEKVSALAQRALLYEIAATPKPGLVDRVNNGAHSDMSFFTFLDSVSVLGPYFKRCALTGIRADCPDRNLLEELRLCGVMAEDGMLEVTNGANTHKGAIFSLGILAAAAGKLYGCGEAFSVGKLSGLCGRIAGKVSEELPQIGIPATHGAGIYRQYGLTGVRGEAASGFRSAVDHGLPALIQAEKQGLCVNDGCVLALLRLLIHVEDTNIAHRGGIEALREIQARIAGKLATVTDAREQLEFAAELDAEFIARGISPGGCADLLAVSLMLKFLTETTVSASILSS